MPLSVSNGPSQDSNAKAFDFGTTPGNYYVESTAPIPGLSNLSEFTITGWLNAKSADTGGGGNRIVSWLTPCCWKGVDLAVDREGRLRLGMNGKLDDSPALSSPGKITIDPDGDSKNWVFFAVTYSASSGHVEYFFGSNSRDLERDLSSTLQAGPIGSKIWKLAVGALNDGMRNPGSYDQMFRGALDDIRIYGSVLNDFNIREVLYENRDRIAPAKPSLTLKSKTASSVHLEWLTPADNVSIGSYIIYAKDLGDPSSQLQINNLPGSANTFNFSDLRTGSTQRFYLEAVDQSSNSSAKDSIDVVLENLPSTDGSLVHLDFNDTGFIFQNLGSASATFTRSISTPMSVSNTPVLVGGSNAIDYGLGVSGSTFTSSTAINELKNLDAFTITGWVNSRSNETNANGNRIVSWINNGGDGADLLLRNDGSLQLGVNQWANVSPAISSAGKVTADGTAAAGNWIFFAVTYSSNGEVQYYFGSNPLDASLDVVRPYPGQGGSAGNISDLTIGNYNGATLNYPTAVSMFKGVIDDVRIYNSVLSPAGVIAVQRGTYSSVGVLPPAAPLNARSTSKTETTATLAWTSSPEDDTYFAAYQIFIGDVLVAETGAVTTYTISGLEPATSYEFTIKAKDAFGNTSARSNLVTVTTDAAFVLGIEDETEKLTELHQNFPNPFEEQTTIELYVRQSVKAAWIRVHDVSGRLLREVEVTGRGNTSIQMRRENLNPGMYYYSLTTDGTKTDAKRMALTR